MKNQTYKRACYHKAAWIIGLILLATAITAWGRPTLTVKETELYAFERHNAQLIYADKPLYRCGEIVKRWEDSEQHFVIIDYRHDGKVWQYSVTPVAVRKVAQP